MKHLKTSLAFSLLLSLVAQAETLPNAGSLSREVEEKPTFQPQQAVKKEEKIATVSNEQDGISIAVRRIEIIGNTAIATENLTAYTQVVENQTITLGQLREVAAKITEHYQTEGYPLAEAVLPPQKIIDGVVTIRVSEGVVSGAKVKNSSRLKDQVVQNYVAQAFHAGQPLRNQTSERALLLIRDLAGINEVNYSLSEGEKAGETLLVANLADAPLFNGSLSAENYGGKSTGEYRTRANLYLNSLFGYGERISLQGMSSFKGVNNGRVGLEAPLGYQGLQLHSSFSHTHYELGGAFKALNASGTANTFDYGLRYPLIRSNDKNLWLAVGGDNRQLVDKVKSTQTETRKRIHSGNISLSGSIQDSLGFGGFTQFSLQNTLGHLRILTADVRTFDAISAKTAGGYYKLNASLNRIQYITPKWSLYAGLNLQWANKNLDSGEQLSLGGVDAVSAYHSNDISVDSGIIGQLELRYALNPYLTLSGFYDVAKGKPRAKPYLNEKNSVNLHGGGVGLYANYKGFNLQTKVAWRGSETKSGNNRNPQVWLKVGYSF